MTDNALAAPAGSAPLGALDELLRGQPIQSRWLITIVVVVMATVGGVWTYFTQLTEVAVATGAVVPQGQVRQVAHLEGGLISGIFVRDGDFVAAGASLVQIELAPNDLNPEEIRGRLDGLLIVRTRLTAESRDEKPVWPAESVARQPAIAQAEQQSYDIRRAQLTTALAALAQVAEQRRLEGKEFESQRTSLIAELDLVTRRFKISEDLLRDAMTTRTEHLDLERSKAQLEGQISTLTVSIPRAQAAFAEAQKKIEDVRLESRREVQKELAENEVNIARVEQVQAEVTRQQGRTTVTSPIDGVIKNIKVRSIGDVVKPGEPFLEVVPLSDTLVVEARLSPDDRGYVSEGQSAMVKVSSYDFVRYGGLNGKVVFIGADADQDDKGNVYFRVRVETDRSFLGSEQQPLPISAGMQATVDIVTGSKSVLARLLRPIQKIRYEAFRER